MSLHSRVHDGYQGEEEDLVGGGGEADQVDQDHDQEGGGDGGHGGRVDLEEQCIAMCQQQDIQIYSNQKYSKKFKPKIIKPNIFSDIQTKDIQSKDIQRYSKIFKPKTFKQKIFKPPGGMPWTPSRQVCFPLHSCTHLVRGGHH